MRLSDVLSKPRSAEFAEIERFLHKKLNIGSSKKIDVGKVSLNFYCNICKDIRTFSSATDLYCIGVTQRQISIDCVLKCAGGCDASVAIWFLVECQDGEDTDKDRQSMNNYIYGIAPKVRILKRREKLSEQVRLVGNSYANYSEMLDKSERAYRDGLGAGAIVYLRKIFEKFTVQIADSAGIPCTNSNGKRKTFKGLLEEVDRQKAIIPKEYSADGYKLFGELSDVLHGDYDEDIGLRKYEALRRLVVGILDNVTNNEEIMSAIGELGWKTGGTPE